MLTIVIGDSHRLFREAAAAHLAEQAEVSAVFEAGSTEEVLDVVCRERPGVVLMDSELPGRDPFEAAIEIRGIDARCKVLFWAMRPYDDHVEAVLACGANGYVRLDDPLATLVEAIREVARGGTFFSRSIAERFETRDGRRRLGPPRTGPLARLTWREWELLGHLGYGLLLKQACAAMRISYKAADSLKTGLTRKLDIHNRVLLARFAMRHGLVCPGGSSEQALRRLNATDRPDASAAPGVPAIPSIGR